MYNTIFAPVDELELEEVFCLSCASQISSEACYVEELLGHMCESCVKAYVSDLEAEAKVSAENSCQLTEPLPRFDAERQFSCSPEEYELGLRESNTPNAHLASCRHGCTNYDALIRHFHRSSESIRDNVFHAAIQNRANEIVISEIERIQPEDAHEFYQFESLPD